MRRSLSRSVAIAMALTIAAALPGYAAVKDPQRARRAIAYLKSQQEPDGSIPAFSAVGSTADAVLAASAVGRGRQFRAAALSYLRAQVEAGAVTTPGLQAKVAMAAVAAGWNPRQFGGVNLISELRARIDPTGEIAGIGPFDHALVALALEADRGKPPKGRPVRSLLAWLLAAQCPGGGWAFDEPYDPATDDANCFNGQPDDFFTADTNTTAYVVMALLFAGRDGWGTDPFDFFRAARDAVADGGHGGWGFTPEFSTTDANSTALVMQSYAAAGKRVPKGGAAALRALQHGCGAFAFTWDPSAPGPPDVGATIGAVPGLLEVALPMLEGPRRIGGAPEGQPC
jgi:hypothetical protein